MFLKSCRISVVTGWVAAVLAFAVTGSPAKAAFTFSIQQVGPNVVVTGSGSINTTGLTTAGAGCGVGAFVFPSTAILIAGSSAGCTALTGVTGPTSFGPGGSTTASSGSGDVVAIGGTGGEVGVPVGYVSGAPLSDTATFNSATLASLGLTPGTYIYTLPNDTLVVQIGPPPPLNVFGSGVEDAFQVNYASQLNEADSVLNITNAGSSARTTGTITSPANTPGLGNICVNIYVFNPDEELEACCSCPLTPNELLSIAYIGSINGASGLLSNTANPNTTNFASAVTKLVATTGTPCNNTKPVFGTPGNVTAALPITTGTLAPGLTAWTTHAHVTNAPVNPNGTLPAHVTETPFVQEILSQGEANFLTNTCATFVQNSSGAGICSCPTQVGGFAIGR